MASEIFTSGMICIPIQNDYPVDLPNLDRFYARLVHIPCGWWVTIEDCDKMIELIKKGW
jgi:hypothetical protein